MTGKSLLRLSGVLLTGLFVFGMIIGSIGFTKLDPMLVVEHPTQVIIMPSRTLFPTKAPEIRDTDTPVATETATIATEPVTIESTATESAATKTATELPPTNTNTPTPSSPLVVQCEYPDGWLPYTVGEDDTVYALALKAKTNTRLLLQANCIGTTEDIQSGTTLFLPPVAFATPTPPPFVCGPPVTWRIVIVKPQETLYGLAIRYGTTVNAIMKANCIRTSTLYAGQQLFVPPYIVVPPTAIPSWTPWPTATPEITPSATVDPTSTPTPLPTSTPDIAATPTGTETSTPLQTPTYTVTPTSPPTEIPSLTPTPTITLIPSLTPTSTPTPTWTPTQTITTTVN